MGYYCYLEDELNAQYVIVRSSVYHAVFLSSSTLPVDDDHQDKVNHSSSVSPVAEIPWLVRSKVRLEPYN